MTESSIKQIFILNGTNYNSWKSRMLLKFELHDLMDAIAHPDTLTDKLDKKNDIKARSFILESIDPSLDNLITAETSAYNMWSKLEQQFNSTTMTTAMEVFTEFVNMKLGENETISDYYNRIVDIYRKLSQFDYTMEQYQLIIFLRGLPPVYEPTISTILQKDIKDWSMLKLRSTLVETQQRIKTYETSEEYASAFKIKKRFLCKFCKRDNSPI